MIKRIAVQQPDDFFYAPIVAHDPTGICGSQAPYGAHRVVAQMRRTLLGRAPQAALDETARPRGGLSR